jgi:hypothetical protein
MPNLHSRLAEIERLHEQRLGQVVDFLKDEHTLSEVSFELFGSVKGYHVLLALEEAGAHVEFLLQRGYVRWVEDGALEGTMGRAARYRHSPTRRWSGLPSLPEL